MPLHEALRVSEVRDYNPDTGAVVVKTYEGTEAQINVVESYWATLNIADDTPTGRGYKTTKTRSARGVSLVVRIPDDQLYTDRWGLDTECVSVPIWWTPEVKSYNPFSADLDLTIASDFRVFMRRVGYIQAASNAITKGVNPATVLAGGGTFNIEEEQIMFLLIKGGGHTERKRPVLKRNRTVPYTVARTTLTGPEIVYSNNTALINNAGVPDEIVPLISGVYSGLEPSFPNFVWGWKERRNDSETQIGFARTVECKDWVFWNWSTITHTIVSS